MASRKGRDQSVTSASLRLLSIFFLGDIHIYTQTLLSNHAKVEQRIWSALKLLLLCEKSVSFSLSTEKVFIRRLLYINPII
jgi:hypothetical protein